MKFTVVIASYLGEYRTAAKNRDKKILRAIDSVLTQTYQDFEIIVVADGCEKTVNIVSQFTDERIKTILIPKSKQWSGEPRNKGIEEATGDLIIYLDIDDVYGKTHLQNIINQIGNFDWVWFDDIRFEPKNEQWYINSCDITLIGKHGTSNICHRRILNVAWNYTGYAHDYYFILELRKNTNFGKIDGGEYYVCHLPGGYDL